MSRSGTGASRVTVDFMTVDGTATALSDYVATTGQIHFNATNPRGGATLGARSSAEVRITDTR